MPDRPLPHASDVDPEVARRMSAAFRALATTEVPDTTPVPVAGPRPAARGVAGGRRRWTIAGGSLLVAAAAVVLAVLFGSEVFDARVATTGPPATDRPAPTTATSTASTPSSSATSTPTAASTAPDAATVTVAFAAVTADTRSPVVAVPGGYEGVDLTGGTGIRLWTSADGTTWAQAGTSVYPPAFGSGTPASVKAAGLPDGADHAVFVVDDQGSTGDGSGVDVAFMAGPSGFGAVKGGADGDLTPSATGVTELGEIGTSYSADFRDGLLTTTECSSTVALAVCGQPGTQIVKSWRWGGTSFVLDHRTGPAS